MKRNKLFLAALSVCLLSACSKDDVPEPGTTPDADLQEANITVMVSTGDIVKQASKAEAAGTAEESSIKNLAIIFVRGGEVQGYGYIDNTVLKQDTTNNVGLKAGEKGTEYIMYVLANSFLGSSMPSTNPEFYKNKLAELSEQGGDSGFVITNTPQKVLVMPGFNYIGLHPNFDNRAGTQISSKELPLERVCARVEMDKLSVAWADEDLKLIDGLKFRLDSVFLANVRRSSFIFPQEANTGVSKLEYKDSGYYYGGGKFAKGGDVATGSEPQAPGLGQSYNQLIANEKEFVFPNFEKTALKEITSYVMENVDKAEEGAYPVIVYLKGTLIDGEGEIVLKDRYYRIKMTNSIERNKVYQIAATITGKGSPEPGDNKENVGLIATITLNDWVVEDLGEIIVTPQ